MNPKYPIFIPSKGRYDSLITARYLDYCKVPYRIVVEPQEYNDYLKNVGHKKKLIVLDLKYKEEYDTCDDLGLEKSTGPGPARNFAWDVSISEGFDHHWVMDDNITSFRRFNKNEKVKVSTGAVFKAMEDFVLRYKNIGMSGPNYYMFQPARQKSPPFILNTRIYSCNLIRNDIPFRWRGRYNEDTILSLDILKKGLCTLQFNAFLQEKMTTQTLRGGNSAEFYDIEGTLAKSKMQVKVHPDVSRIVKRFGRIHHYVDYSPFKINKLIRKENYKSSKKVNNYGMSLKLNHQS